MSGSTACTGLRLTGCLLEEPLALCDATLPWLLLDACVLPGVSARRARIAVVRIRDSEITGSHPGGAVQLDGAQLAGGLRLDGTRITSIQGPALSATGLAAGLAAGAAVVLDGLHATGRAGAGGLLRLDRAQIGGSLCLRGAWLANATGPALMADGITVRGDLELTRRARAGTEFTAAGAAGQGTVLARGATITGTVSLEGARVKSVSSQAPGAPGPAASGPLDSPAAEAALVVAAPPGPPGGPPARPRRGTGAVCLSGAAIGGDLILRQAVLAGGTLPALMAENVTVHGHLGGCDAARDGFRATGAGPLGVVCLSGARIGGQLALRGAVLASSTGPALRADLATVGEGARLEHDFTAEGAGPPGTVRLTGATVSGGLSLAGARLANGSGPALQADRITVHGDVLLTQEPSGGPFTAGGAGSPGTVLLRGAAVSGQLSLAGAAVQHGGTSVAEQVGGQVRSALGTRRAVPLAAVTAVLRGFERGPAPGQPPAGAVSLSAARVSGALVLTGARLCSDSGPALLARQLAVHGDVVAGGPAAAGLTAIGAGELGAVCLAGAAVGGELALAGATLASATGPALVASGAQTGGDVVADEFFAAVGTGPHGAVCLAGARVGGVLRCAGRLVNPHGAPPAAAREPALNLAGATVGGLQLGGHGPAGFDADGSFQFDGLRYAGLPDLGDPGLVHPRPAGARRPGWLRRRAHLGDPGRHGEQVAVWLSWLRHNVPGYQAQPYDALAAAYGAAGYDDLARVIRVAQRDDARDRGSLSPLRTAVQHAAKWLIGYGYHCCYALFWLAGLVAVTALLAVCWLGPARYIRPATAPGAAAAARPAPARAARAGPSASPAGPASPSASASPATPATQASPGSPSASPAATATHATSTHATAARGPRERAPAGCPVVGQVGYAVRLAVPFLGSGGPAGQCGIPAAGASGWVAAFGWVVRAAAITLLVLYGVGLSGVTRRPPSGA